MVINIRVTFTSNWLSKNSGQDFEKVTNDVPLTIGKQDQIRILCFNSQSKTILGSTEFKFHHMDVAQFGRSPEFSLSFAEKTTGLITLNVESVVEGQADAFANHAQMPQPGVFENG